MVKTFEIFAGMFFITGIVLLILITIGSFKNTECIELDIPIETVNCSQLLEAYECCKNNSRTQMITKRCD